MNLWIIVAVTAGLLIVAGIAVVSVVTANAEQETETIECKNCENSCSSYRNCGLATCEAVSSGAGCGCGR